MFSQFSIYIAFRSFYQSEEIISHLFFFAYLLTTFLIAWKIISFLVEYYGEKIKISDPKNGKVILPLLHRISQGIIIIIWFNILLSRFGINLGSLATAMGIGGLAISLAAQDTLGDLISGFTILLDKPFVVGDRIEIQELNTWGDVVEIGTRTTKIRTRDNRMVIVPNSIISKSQIVNYAYSGRRHRIETDIKINYGNDVDKVKQTAHEAISHIDGVLKDKPVQTLYNEMAEGSMIFRFRWWIESYEDTRLIHDRVNTALQKAFDQNGITIATPAQEITLKKIDA